MTTPTLPPLGPLPAPKSLFNLEVQYTAEQMQSYATAYGAECARAAVTAQPMVDMVPPATARDRWMYEQGRLAERDPRTPPAVEARALDERAAFDSYFRSRHDLDPRTDTTNVGGAFEPWKAWEARAALSAAPAAPGPQAVAEPVATLLDFDIRSQIGTVDLHGEWMDLRVGDKLFATQPPTQQAAPAEWSGRDAYDGAREDLLIWKRRALEAERDLRAEKEVSSRLVAEINATNGPAFMGEPSHQQAEVEKVGPVGLLRGDGTFHWFPPYPGPFWKDILLYAAPQQASAQGEPHGDE